MAVVQVASMTVKPDRMEDLLGNVRKSKTIMERMGAKNVRLLAATVAGEATGSLALVSEVVDFAAWGAHTDKLFADPEMMAVISSGSSAAGPVVGHQVTIWVDVPL